MELDTAVHTLRRYQRWRRGEGARDFEQAGFTVAMIGEALDEVLLSVNVLAADNRSLRARLAKCQVQREKLHSQLRAKK